MQRHHDNGKPHEIPRKPQMIIDKLPKIPDCEVQQQYCIVKILLKEINVRAEEKLRCHDWT